VTEQFFIENQLMHVPHPPHNPDLAPSDFWLFGPVKTALDGGGFAEPEELFEGVREFREGIPAAELTAIFEGWINRMRWVIAHRGNTIVAKCYAINLGFRLPASGSAAETY
jgi:hypothetical protein